MATKIKLGNRPKTFKAIDVKVQLPDGSEGLIPITFKYRDRREFGRWQDNIKNSFPELKTGEDFNWEAFYTKAGDLTADYILDAVDSWGLDEPLNKESLLQVESECGASALPAILSAYGEACRDGRLGN